jgi:hypothetical protein
VNIPPKTGLQHGFYYLVIKHGNGESATIKGSLEVKLPTMWTDKQQTWEESEKRKETLQPPVTPSATLQQLNLSYGVPIFELPPPKVRYWY